jgi:aminoglycoside 6-adenylyltransferase
MHREERLDSIIAWAEDNPDIRAALLTSSLVNPLAPVDDHSDLDIELVFTDGVKYASDDTWLHNFGIPIAVFDEADARVGEPISVKMVLFEDRGKVDFILHDVRGFVAQVGLPEMPVHWDIGYKVLVDKDGLTKNLKSATYQASIIKKPSRDQFEKLLFDFWWDTTYVAKCLARDEIFYAKYMSETVIRTNYLVPVIEWWIASQHDWTITTNKHGRLFKKYLPESQWTKLERTFSAADMKGNMDALQGMMDLVHELGEDLAKELGYAYPVELEKRIREYVGEERR